MPNNTKPVYFDRIKSWLNTVDGEKQASAKTAKAKLDPGGYAGATTHPSKDIDNKTHDAPEGFRSRENESDIKEDVPTSVDETKPGSGGDQDSHQMHVGMNPSATGEDPSVEDDYKGDKDDPGTTHPANADDAGKKYGSDLSSLLKMHKQASDDLLAAVSVLLHSDQQPNSFVNKNISTTKQAEEQPTASEQAVAGHDLAAALGFSKEAADQLAAEMLANVKYEAIQDADRVGPYLVAYFQEREKIAAEMSKKANPMLGGDPAAGGMPPGAEGELPPEAAMGGMPPEGGEGGPGGPGGGEEAALQQLAMALMELGISPEELIEAVSGGGGAGGPPPGAGGPPPGGEGGLPPDAGGSPADMAGKIASAVKQYKRSGKFRIEPAKTAAERNYRNEMKQCIMEIIGQ